MWTECFIILILYFWIIPFTKSQLKIIFYENNFLSYFNCSWTFISIYLRLRNRKILSYVVISGFRLNTNRTGRSFFALLFLLELVRSHIECDRVLLVSQWVHVKKVKGFNWIFSSDKFSLAIHTNRYFF